jgi:hypothetical protein
VGQARQPLGHAHTATVAAAQHGDGTGAGEEAGLLRSGDSRHHVAHLGGGSGHSGCHALVQENPLQWAKKCEVGCMKVETDQWEWEKECSGKACWERGRCGY